MDRKTCRPPLFANDATSAADWDRETAKRTLDELFTFAGQYRSSQAWKASGLIEQMAENASRLGEKESGRRQKSDDCAPVPFRSPVPVRPRAAPPGCETASVGKCLDHGGQVTYAPRTKHHEQASSMTSPQPEAVAGWVPAVSGRCGPNRARTARAPRLRGVRVSGPAASRLRAPAKREARWKSTISSSSPLCSKRG